MISIAATLITQTPTKWYLQVGQKKIWIFKNSPDRCKFNAMNSELLLTPYFKDHYQL